MEILVFYLHKSDSNEFFLVQLTIMQPSSCVWLYEYTATFYAYTEPVKLSEAYEFILKPAKHVCNSVHKSNSNLVSKTKKLV